MDIKKVLISDSCDKRCADILEKAGCQVTVKTDFTKEELVKAISEYDALVVRSATKVTEDIINNATNLKVIGRAGTGVDNIDCVASTKNGVLVINAPGGNTLSAAEMTCALIVSLSRDVASACASLKAGKWDRKYYMGNELYGKTLGVVGLGRIGREVATRMQSFGMKTIGFDPIIPKEAAAEFNVESMTLDELWPQCDYITVHTPLIPQTRNLIGKETLAKCKKGVKIVNCARGGIVNELDLLEALESGQASGAGFDVFEEEPPKNTAFIAHPKVICTPHLGANTKEAQARVAIEIAEQFVALKNGESILGAVNAPLLSLSQSAENVPYAQLAIRLGKVAGALCGSSTGPAEITLEAFGGGFESKAKFLASACGVGLLQQLGNDKANFINVGGLVEKNNITLSGKASSANICGGCTIKCLKLTVKSGSNQHTVIGSASGDVSLLRFVDDSRFCGGVALTGKKIIALGAANQLGSIVQATSALGNVTSVATSSASGDKAVYILGSEICTKSTAAPAPLTCWSNISF